jgi:DNA invertase Pin-like site-specific DNA recombinase
MKGDDSNPTAKLVRQILSAVSEFERCVIVLKMRGAKERRRIADPDWREGRLPYGSKPGEAETLEWIRQARAAGMTLQKITDDLHLQGTVARSGKPWTVGAVGKILAR